MNRQTYFEYIEKQLHLLSVRIESRGKLNLLDIHGHSENFYLHLFNLMFDYELVNLNKKTLNVASIDLIDENNKIIIQVSATSTKAKIESSLGKEILKEFPGYTFKFISISKDASDLKKNTYENPCSIKFVPSNDIYDIVSLLNHIREKDIDYIEKIYRFIKKELGVDIDREKLDSNLTTIIIILSKEQWDEMDNVIDANSFEIERKITVNDLKIKSELIKEYSLYHSRINQKYNEFDLMGANKSRSVLASIRRLYLGVKDKYDADTIFSLVIDGVKEQVLDSNNFEKMPIDELELCVEILVVDAFIRCKIFENPEGYCYATS
ncbi:MAG: ABC-three component system protein [Methanolobus sp.]|nr:ABC-three component system protein [Methanolobus sp.]